MEFIFIILGLVGLVVGAELTIKGALVFADHYKLSNAFVGLTILAVGTDLPELFIVLTGSLYTLGGVEMSDLVIGEIIGSAMAQITIVLGLLGILGLISTQKKRIIRDGVMMLFSVLIVFLAGFDGTIDFVEGVVMVLVYVLYVWGLYKGEKVNKTFRLPKNISLIWASFYLFGGFIVLLFFSNITLDNAILLSTRFNIPQYIVGFLVVGLGTSLPELVTSLIAIRKKAVGMAIGNLFGSNILDVLCIVGIGATIADFSIHPSIIQFDIPFLFVVSLLVILLFLKTKKLSRKGSVTLVLIYVLFFVLKLSAATL